MMPGIRILTPELQISFVKIPQKTRETYLREALSGTIDAMDLSRKDRQTPPVISE
jgi:hypothetical protein